MHRYKTPLYVYPSKGKQRVLLGSCPIIRRMMCEILFVSVKSCDFKFLCGRNNGNNIFEKLTGCYVPTKT